MSAAPHITRIAHDLKRRRLTVARVEKLAPGMRRVVLRGKELAGFTSLGFDDHMKLFFFNAGVTEMRDFTPRRFDAAAGELWIDFFLHDAGPAAEWAACAVTGQSLEVGGPKRSAVISPDGIDEHVLIGDETALPAIASILTDLDDTASGVVFVEVPDAGDIVDLAAPPGIEVCWLPRGHTDSGTRVIPAVRSHFGLEQGEWVDPSEIDPDLWETPTYSSSGEPVADDGPGGTDHAGLYAWIAGEAKVVTTLRRALVGVVGLDRRQVAFMGYWRHGKAEH